MAGAPGSALLMPAFQNLPARRPPGVQDQPLQMRVLLSAVKTAAAKGELRAGLVVGWLVAASSGPWSETE